MPKQINILINYFTLIMDLRYVLIPNQKKEALSQFLLINIDMHISIINIDIDYRLDLDLHRTISFPV